MNGQRAEGRDKNSGPAEAMAIKKVIQKCRHLKSTVNTVNKVNINYLNAEVKGRLK